MLKRLRLAGWWVFALALVTGAIVLMACKYEKARIEYQSACRSDMARMETFFGHKQDGADECSDPKEYMPWGYILIAWPDGITAWALLLTLWVIGYQSYHTRRAADGALLNAEAALRQAKLVEEQVALQRSERRGVLEVSCEPIEADAPVERHP